MGRKLRMNGKKIMIICMVKKGIRATGSKTLGRTMSLQ